MLKTRVEILLEQKMKKTTTFDALVTTGTTKVYWRMGGREKGRKFDKQKDGYETGDGKWLGRVVATSTL